MKETVARFHIYLLVIAGRADEAVPIADTVLRDSSHPHVRRTPPFVHWSAGDVSEMDKIRDTAPAPDINARDRFFHAALATHVAASVGDAGKLLDLGDQLETMPLNLEEVRDASMLAAASAVRLVALHDEDGAGHFLAEHLHRHPLSDPRCDMQLRRALTTVYVCAPEVRPAWDRARLGRCHRRMHATAAALVAVRQVDTSGRQPSGALCDAISDALTNTDALITMVPLAYSVELAARAHGLGLPAGAHAIELLSHRVGDQVTAEMRWQQSHGDDLVRNAVKDLLDSRPVGELPHVRIEVIGSTRVLIDGQPAENTSARRARVRQLLTLLVVEPSLRRDRAMALLWPDLDQNAASRNLRVTLTYLRQLFQDGGSAPAVLRPRPDERFLLVDSSSIRLVAGPGLEVDLWELDAQVVVAARARAAGDVANQTGALTAVAALWHGQPLVDLPDHEELTAEATRVRAALIDSVLSLGEIRLTEGRVIDAVQHSNAVLAADPFVERAHRLSLAAQLQLGDHRAVRAAAQRMNEALGAVGAVPTERTQILLRRTIALAPALA